MYFKIQFSGIFKDNIFLLILFFCIISIGTSLSLSCSQPSPTLSEQKSEGSQQGQEFSKSQSEGNKTKEVIPPDFVDAGKSQPEESTRELEASIDKVEQTHEKRFEAPVEQKQPPEKVKESPQDKNPSSCKPATGNPENKVKQWIELAIDGKAVNGKLLPCGVYGYRFVASAGMKVVIEVQGIPKYSELALFVANARRINLKAKDTYLAKASNNRKGWISLTTDIDISGEINIILDSRKNTKPISYQISAYCDKNCHLETTRFPVVLMHGFAGTDKYFGLLDYFYQVKPLLSKKGYAAYTPKVQPIASSTARVKRLKTQIDQILKKTGARKLNLIAHSQGGVDGRLLISRHKYAKNIISLTTISTPHRGVPVPNVLIPPSGELGEKNMKKYNKLYPNSPLVKYFSWAGVTCSRFDSKCKKKYKGEVVDVLLAATYHTLKGLRGSNDGLIPVSSAKWGIFLGEIPADHWDEIGQVADKKNKAFNHKNFYLQEVRRLKKAGL